MSNKGVKKFVEIGPGKILSGLIKRIDRNLELISVNDIDDIKNKKNPYLEFEVQQGNYDIYDLFLNLDDKNIKTTVSHTNEW